MVETKDASCDLHKSLCLLLLSRKLLMDLTLARRRCLSAFLIIFFAFSVLIVVLTFLLIGIKLKLKFLVYSVLEPAVGYLTTLHFNSQQGTHPTLV